MRITIHHFISIFTLILFMSCASKKEIVYIVLKPPALEKDLYSDIIINYRLDKKGITDTLNYAISETFKSGFDMLDYDIKMVLTKPKPATIEIEGKNILVNVPVDIVLEKKTFFTDIKAQGSLEMSFISIIDIDSLWNLNSLTSLSHHRWVEKPKISIVGLNVPIETISNGILRKTKIQIEQSIDESIKANFLIKQKLQESLVMFDNPMQIDTSESAWLNFKPQKIELSGILNRRFSAVGKINMTTLSTFSTYKPASNKISRNLPKVSWSDIIPDSSVFRLWADIKMEDVNRMLKLNLEGQTFYDGDKHLTLSNMVTNCDYEFLEISANVRGSINGTLIIKGKLKYDELINGFYMDNIDIKLKTKNVLHKAAAWLAEGKIRKDLQESMKFSITENISTIQKNINAQILEMNKKYGMEFKINIGSIKMESFQLSPGKIEGLMKAVFYLELFISDFRSFNNF